MFITRTISGFILVVIVALAFYLGPLATNILMCFVSLVGVMELLRVYKLNKRVIGWINYIFTIGYYALLYFMDDRFTLPLIVLYVLIIMALFVLTYPKYTDKEILEGFLPFFYVAMMLSFVYRIRGLEHGGILVILIFVSSWGNDTCAYLVGRAIGKHKMSPKLSPKKSVEGLIGGIVGAALLGALFGFLFDRYVDTLAMAPVIFAVIGGIGALPAVVGDLAASAIKRNNDIKDYGKLIPGHGGVMDRFDSIIFTAPIVYYLLIFMFVK